MLDYFRHYRSGEANDRSGDLGGYVAGSVNKIILVGNVGRDPEIRSMQNGGRVASFSLATSERWLDKVTNEYKDSTQWHRVSIFNENVINVVEKYVKRGSKLFVEGSMNYGKYTDQNGQERTTAEVVISKIRGNIVLLDSKGSESTDYNPRYGNEASLPEKTNASKGSSISDDIDDDIPF